MEKFADLAFDFSMAQSNFEEGLGELLGEDVEYDKIGWDSYDTSLEIYQVDNTVALSDAAQKFIFDNGFAKVYVNHKDGWETHYSWERGKDFKSSRGWRRKRTENGFEISHWPEGWNTPTALAWLKTGYMKIVGDNRIAANEQG